MSNWIYDGTALPATKVDYIPLLVGQNIINYSTASDWNAVFTALGDLRSSLKWWQGTTKTTNYTAATSDYAVLCNATGLTITLPVGAQGLTFLVKDITGNATPNHTINTSSSQTIDGGATKTINSAYGWVAVVWDVTNGQWRVWTQPTQTTLQSAYSNGTAGAQIITEDGTRLGVIVRQDSGATADPVFAVQTNSGGTDLLNVNGTRVRIGKPILMDALGSNTITMSQAGLYNGNGPPTFTTASAGEKLTLVNRIDGANTNLAIGVDATGGNGMWFSTSTAVAADTFKWYGGVTELMRCTGAGNLLLKTGQGVDSIGSGTFTVGGSNAVTLQLGGTSVTALQLNAGGTRWTVGTSGTLAPINDALTALGSNTLRILGGYFSVVRSGDTAAADTAGSVLTLIGQGGGPASAATGGAGGQVVSAGGAGGSASASFAGGAGGIGQCQGGSGGNGSAAQVAGNGGIGRILGGPAGTNNGGGSGTGGAATVTSGAGSAGSGATAGGGSGALTLTVGTPGAGTGSAAGGNAGTLTLAGGPAGTNGGSGGGTAGVVLINAGTGAAANGASAATTGGASSINGGVGGNGSASVAAANGGGATTGGGNGGVASTGGAGGAGGTGQTAGGNGGAGSASTAAGVGGVGRTFGGNGGTNNGGGGAQGGAANVFGGVGSAANAASVGQPGGGANITGGVGGAGSATGAAGVGATVSIAGGASGANGGGGGAAGGNVSVRGGVGSGAAANGNVTIGDANTSAVNIGAAGTPINLGEGTITQITSITTGVTVNASSGVITTVAANTAALGTSTFTVTNSCAVAASVVNLSFNYAGAFSTNGFPDVQVGTVSAGSFQVIVTNAHATNALNGVMKIFFTLT